MKKYRKQYYQKRRLEEPVTSITEHVNRILKNPCIRCGSKVNFPVQMIPPQEVIGNLIPLCPDCGFSYFSKEWDISEIEDKLKDEYPDQYWWLQIEKSS